MTNEEIKKLSQQILSAVCDVASETQTKLGKLKERDVMAACGLAIGAICLGNKETDNSVEQFLTAFAGILNGTVYREDDENEICNCPKCVTERTMENLFS